MKQINIIVTTQFDAIHSWSNCDIEEVAYLKNSHRHVFHVIVKCAVQHTDRDIEIIRLKRQIDNYLLKFKGKNIGDTSCEDIAVNILTEFSAVYVSVLEDNENGAEVYV